ncbi:uncharacterized protein [Cebidichthys violaceus]|uniref:uncharacterized protein isoform X1 n=1 Tax=Cebidichthys violaceus TaxID=271503 RepID=UPI0035CA1B4B
MDFFSKFLVLVIIVIIFACLVISLIFIFINKCLSRAGKHRIMQFPRESSDFTAKINQYQERNFDAKTPPLPSRSQFFTAEAQSYENLAEEQNISDYEQDKQCDYVKLEDGVAQSYENLAEEQNFSDYEQDKQRDCVKLEDGVAQSYENLAEEQNFSDYEQDKQRDCVKLEDGGETLPLPPEYQDPDPAEDNASTEDYDDIGGEDENEGEEDYDDVG